MTPVAPCETAKVVALLYLMLLAAHIHFYVTFEEGSRNTNIRSAF